MTGPERCCAPSSWGSSKTKVQKRRCAGVAGLDRHHLDRQDRFDRRGRFLHAPRIARHRVHRCGRIRCDGHGDAHLVRGGTCSAKLADRAGSGQCAQEGASDVELERSHRRERVADELGLRRDRTTVGTPGAGRRPDLLADAEVQAERPVDGTPARMLSQPSGRTARARLPRNIVADAVAAMRETSSPMTATAQGQSCRTLARTGETDSRRRARLPLATQRPPADQARRCRLCAASEPARTRRLAMIPMTPPATAMPPGTRTVSTARREEGSRSTPGSPKSDRGMEPHVCTPRSLSDLEHWPPLLVLTGEVRLVIRSRPASQPVTNSATARARREARERPSDLTWGEDDNEEAIRGPLAPGDGVHGGRCDRRVRRRR